MEAVDDRSAPVRPPRWHDPRSGARSRRRGRRHLDRKRHGRRRTCRSGVVHGGRCRRARGHAGRRGSAQPRRGAQSQRRPPDRTSPRTRACGWPCRRAHDSCDRGALRRPRLHHGLRCGDRHRCGGDRARRARRPADSRQGHLSLGCRRRRHACRPHGPRHAPLRGPAPGENACRPWLGREGGQSWRAVVLEIRPARRPSRPRHAAPRAAGHAPADPRPARAGRAVGRPAALAPRAHGESRPAGQLAHDARNDAHVRRPARPPRPRPVSQLFRR